MPSVPQPRHDLSAGQLAWLEDQLYAFNAAATGRDDAQPIAFTIDGDDGSMIAAATGHYWAGTAELKLLWVADDQRNRGLGKALLDAFVDAARHLGAQRLWVSSHGFQAPAFYERAGFERMATFDNWPQGHANIVLCKVL